MLKKITDFTKDLLMREEASCSNGPFCTSGEVWFEIFKRCDGTSLGQLEQTCRLFYNVLHRSRFWLEKCEYDGVSLPPLAWRKLFRQRELNEEQDVEVMNTSYLFNYKSIYHRRPYNRNLAPLLRNTSTLKKLRKEGMVFESSGDGIIIENPPIYCDSSEVSVCFATSYGWCHRYFEIDLEKAGIEAWIMDVVRPIITVRERCACREDCGAEYELKVQLLKEDEHFDSGVILPRFRTSSRSWNQWEGGKFWETVEHVFSEYPTGMRKIGVMSRGKDTQFWAGHYGAKFGATEVYVNFPEAVRELTPDDFPDEEKKFREGVHRPMRHIRVPVGIRGRFPARRAN